MLQVSEYIIDSNDELDKCSRSANKLYNASLYQIRQHFFKRNYVNYYWLDKYFKEAYRNRQSMLYRSLCYVQSAQQTLKETTQVWYAWTQAIKAYKVNPKKFTGKPNLPGYLEKDKRHNFFVMNSSAQIKGNYLVIKRLNIKFKLDKVVLDNKIKRVEFVPIAKERFKVLVQYEIPDKKMKSDNDIYVGIDPGLNNAFTCVTNAHKKPLIINGKGAKSINQFYNKKIAELNKKHAQYGQCYKLINTKQGQKKVYYHSKAMDSITYWRNTKISQFAHKATKRIVDYALSCGANTIIIGKIKNQKRNINMGKRNNQNFVGIPHSRMIDMIKYKAAKAGINVITVNEAYTSQTSFLDNEKPCKQNGNYQRKLKHLSPANRRVHRGLFKSNKGILINADVNGACQIIRKVFPKFKYNLNDGIERFVLSPIKYNVNF